jgi:poly(3-hydroxybutyrate) depolymerase
MESMDIPLPRSIPLCIILALLPLTTQAQSDFGDAPATYQTLLPNGARHTIVLSGPRLGTLIDPEADGQPGTAAQGDDGTTLDDEDGVVGPVQWEANTLVTLQVTVNQACRLDAWVDWRGDTSWGGGVEDTLDQIALARPLQAGVNSVSVFVPPFAVAGVTYARFRVSTTGGLGTGGLADDGEVEDYALLIAAAALAAIPTLEVMSPSVIRWQGNPAYSSQMEHSADLTIWKNYWLPEQETIGTNEVLVPPSLPTGSRHFYRLVRTPLLTTPIPLPAPGGESAHRFVHQTFVHGGIARRYRLKLPNHWVPTSSWPLVMLLPGHGQSAEEFWDNRGGTGELLDLANGVESDPGSGWILCVPEATTGEESYRWFAYNDPRLESSDPSLVWLDDYAFVKALTQSLIDSALNIDKARVFCAGFSNGANMTHYIGSKPDHPFAAFAMFDGGIQSITHDRPVGTFIAANNPVPTIARPVLINNQIDSVAWPYEGRPFGPGATPYNFGAPCPPVRGVVAVWAKANGVAGAEVDLVSDIYTTPAASSISTHTWDYLTDIVMRMPISDARLDVGWPQALLGQNGWTQPRLNLFPDTDPPIPAAFRSLYPHTLAPDPNFPALCVILNGTWTEEKWTPSLPGRHPYNEVVLLTMSSGGHNWPEGDSPWDGNIKLLEFFAAHPLPTP